MLWKSVARAMSRNQNPVLLQGHRCVFSSRWACTPRGVLGFALTELRWRQTSARGLLGPACARCLGADGRFSKAGAGQTL